MTAQTECTIVDKVNVNVALVRNEELEATMQVPNLHTFQANCEGVAPTAIEANKQQLNIDRPKRERMIIKLGD